MTTAGVVDGVLLIVLVRAAGDDSFLGADLEILFPRLVWILDLAVAVVAVVLSVSHVLVAVARLFCGAASQHHLRIVTMMPTAQYVYHMLMETYRLLGHPP